MDYELITVKYKFDDVPFDEEEALRYAGIKGEADEACRKLLKEAVQLLRESVTLSGIYTKVPVKYAEDGVFLGDDLVKSKSLKVFLQNCEQAYLFSATAGIAADRLILRYSMISPSLAVVIDACAAALVEAMCNKLCIKTFCVRKCQRFSPGYGDCPIEYQKSLISKLKTELNIGVTLTESLMLTPSKSVTAIVPVCKG